MGKGPIELNKEKLVALIIVDDEIGQMLSSKASETFVRAFIVEDRQTGEISARMRFRYDDHDAWIGISPSAENQKLSRAELVSRFQEGIEMTFRGAMTAMSGGIVPPKKVIDCRYPPDDEGQPMRTVKWMQEQDLIKPPRYVPIEEYDRTIKGEKP